MCAGRLFIMVGSVQSVSPTGSGIELADHEIEISGKAADEVGGQDHQQNQHPQCPQADQRRPVCAAAKEQQTPQKVQCQLASPEEDVHPSPFSAPPSTLPEDPEQAGVSSLLNTTDHNTYLRGYSAVRFGPEDAMTRAQAAQLFYGLLKGREVPITVTFTDVPADAWYKNAVETLASLGIVSGVGDGRFIPDRPMTRWNSW